MGGKADTEVCGILQVQECLDALVAGKEWQSTRQPQLLEDEDEAEVSSSALTAALLMRLAACSAVLVSWLLRIGYRYARVVQATAWLTGCE